MSVKCGNKAAHGGEPGRHETVAQVRLCYHRTFGPAVLESPESREVPVVDVPEPTPEREVLTLEPVPAPAPASLAQAFRASVQRVSVAADNDADDLDPPVSAREPKSPRLSKAELRTALASIPVGAKGVAYFALEREDSGDSVLKFYRVERDKGGFVSLAAQGGPTFYPVNFRNAVPVLLEIAKDPARAGKRYADEVGRCMYCNLELTDEISRSYGAGPVCRRKRGMV